MIISQTYKIIHVLTRSLALYFKSFLCISSPSLHSFYFINRTGIFTFLRRKQIQESEHQQQIATSTTTTSYIALFGIVTWYLSVQHYGILPRAIAVSIKLIRNDIVISKVLKSFASSSILVRSKALRQKRSTSIILLFNNLADTAVLK